MVNAIRSIWVSISGLEIVFGLIGTLMGGVFVLSSWRGSLKGSDLKSDPRIKSLGWAIVGFFATLLGRWEKFFDLDKLDRGRLLLSYTLPLLGTAILGVAAIALTIYMRTASVKKKSSAGYLWESFAPVLDYLHYGYLYYRQQEQEASKQNEGSELRRFQKVNAMAASQLAGDIAAVERYHLDPSEALRATVSQHILEHVCLIVQTYMEVGSQPNLNANIMVAIPAAHFGEADWKSVKFAYQAHEQYGYLLALTYYARPEGQEHFSIPVVDPVQVPDWENWVLLGAPVAFLRQEGLVVQTHELDFAQHVPHNIRKEIQGYFRRKGFRSFACLVIPGEGKPRGILNVESNQEHIFQESEELQSEIARLLEPFCVLLGSIAS